MSAIAAVLSFGSPFAAVERLERLLDLQKHAGPDGHRHLQSGPCAIGLCTMTTTPEDHVDSPCAYDACTNLHVAIDGFVSNRDALGVVLGISARELGAMGDARLVARAYGRWREQAFEKIDGEFCIALWDSGTNTCVVARDVFGIRPAYYSSSADSLCVASELQALHAIQPSRVNEGMIAEALVWRRTSMDETLFTGVKRLPPGHLLVASVNGASRIRRYWTPDLDSTLRLKSDDDYAAACRAQVKRAVTGVMRSDRPVGLMLSGGMDSGVIAAEVAALEDTRPPLAAYTVTFPGTAVDEGPWARETAEHTHVPWTAALPAAQHYDFVGESRKTKQLPSYPSNANSVALRAAATRSGTRILLTGMGGDEWFYGSDWRYADLLTRGRLWKWGREVWADRHVYGWSFRRLMRDSVLPIVPREQWVTIGRLVGRASDRGLITDAFASRTNLEDRLAADWIPRARRHARRDIGRVIYSGAAVAAHEEMAQLGALTQTIHRHPFYSRELVTFALALPEEQRRHRGVTKRVVRRAYAPLLPPGVVERVSSFTYDFLMTEVIRKLVRQGIFQKPRVVENGWVPARPIDDLVAAVAHGPCDGQAAKAAMQLWPTASVEVWLNGMLG
jgi:asparagine synthase (glutamine-hydrolysing)